MKSTILLRSTAAAVALVGALASPVAMASAVILTFGVSNVNREVCTGLLQPTCSSTAVGGFNERLTIDSAAISRSDLGGGGFLYTSALFGFPFASSGNPYTPALQSILTQAPTSTTAFSQFENDFDPSSAIGLATGQVFTDQSYDDGRGSTGDFQLNYSLQTVLGSQTAYQDLTTASLYDFANALVNQLEGSFFELGSASVLDGNTGVFTSYAYTAYTGDVTLIGVASDVAAVPEPATLALVAVALGAAGLGRRTAARRVGHA